MGFFALRQLNQPMSSLKIAARYTAFAIIATLINLLSQELSLAVYRATFALPLAILAGTAAGLITKYTLDKNFIFNHVSSSHRDSIKTFGGYTFTGVFTTALFWISELGLHWLLGTEAARITGAILGLAVGYGIKYQLDKRYVFTPRDTA